LIVPEFPAEPPGPPPALLVRDARPGDEATILEFNARLAFETEGKRLDRDVLARGVGRALADPDRLRYWVAETDDDRTVVGQAAVTREWSDWRDGWVWWLQSIYVRPDFRRRGALRALHRHILDRARDARDVIGLRLYVDDRNERAHRTYQALGLEPGGYRVFEDLWPERFGAGPAG
jgi:GNAT superfamily N-acetyltransferase